MVGQLQALLDSQGIAITTLPEDVLDSASYFGRIFARSGGLSDDVAEGLKEQHLDNFQLNACACDGIVECRLALLKKSKNALDANVIEGMACLNGCIGGAGNLTHGEKNKAPWTAMAGRPWKKPSWTPFPRCNKQYYFASKILNEGPQKSLPLEGKPLGSFHSII